MQFFKEYPALVTAIGSLVGIVLGYFLGRWSTKDERAFNRRAVVYDKRIQEAKLTLDTWSKVIDLFMHSAYIMSNEKSFESAMPEVNTFAEPYSDLPLMEAFNKKTSIDILNDFELTKLREEFYLKVEAPLTSMFDIEDDKTFKQKKSELKAYATAFGEVQDILVQMKIRLDKLAEKVP